jgi:hypothetical protein
MRDEIIHFLDENTAIFGNQLRQLQFNQKIVALLNNSTILLTCSNNVSISIQPLLRVS